MKSIYLKTFTYKKYYVYKIKRKNEKKKKNENVEMPKKEKEYWLQMDGPIPRAPLHEAIYLTHAGPRIGFAR